MKMKKIALKGLAILAAVLALCAFFSGTIRTITTPKVRFVSPRMGKLEEKIPITAEVYFPEIEEIKPVIDGDYTFTIKKVNTRAGYIVEKGDILIEAEVTGYGEKIAAYTKEYEDAERDLAALERKNADIRVRSADINYVGAQQEYQAARSDSVLKEIAVDTLLEREGLEWNEDGTLPEGVSEEIETAAQDYAEALERLDAAQSAWDRAKRYSIDEEVYAYLKEKSDLERKMAEAEAGIRTISTANAMAAQIIAPHDGYAAEINVKVGDNWDGTAAMMTISAPKSDPVFRADLSGVERTVSKKSDVQIEGRYGAVESRVDEVVTETDGKKYAYIDLNKDVLEYVGSVYSLMQAEGGREMTLVYEAKEATCLVPVSAVHGSGDDRYVYVVESRSGALGSAEMTVRKMSVQVEAEVEGVASLSDDISWYTLAYMEDRAISDGDRVMEYTE